MSLSCSAWAAASLLNFFSLRCPLVPMRPNVTIVVLPSSSMFQNFLELPSTNSNVRMGALPGDEWGCSIVRRPRLSPTGTDLPHPPRDHGAVAPPGVENEAVGQAAP